MQYWCRQHHFFVAHAACIVNTTACTRSHSNQDHICSFLGVVALLVTVWRVLFALFSYRCNTMPHCIFYSLCDNAFWHNYILISALLLSFPPYSARCMLCFSVNFLSNRLSERKVVFKLNYTHTVDDIISVNTNSQKGLSLSSFFASHLLPQRTTHSCSFSSFYFCLGH